MASMTRLHCATFAGLAGVSAVATMVLSGGCSSTGNASANNAAATEAGVDASPRSTDGDGAAARLKLVWRIAQSGAPLGRGDGVGPEGGDAGAVSGDASADGSTVGSDAATDGSTVGSDAATDGPVANGPGVADAGAPVGGGGPPGIPGVKVCVYQNDSIPCATTDANGLFTLGGLPMLSDIALTLNKDGYRPLLKPIETSSTDMDGTANAITMVKISDPEPPLPITIDWKNKGQLIFFAIGPDPDGGNRFGADPGAMVSLTPMSGSGPYFLTDHNTFDLSASGFVAQAALDYNLDPGNYELKFIDSTHDCAPISIFAGYGYPSPPTSVKFPIVAGYTTGLVGVLCTTKSVIVNAGH